MSEKYRMIHQQLREKPDRGPEQDRMLQIMDDAFSTGLGSQALQGLTLNWADEVIGSMRAMAGSDDLKWLSGQLKEYGVDMSPTEIGRHREEEAVEVYQQENTGSAIAAQMAGSLPHMILPGGQASTLSKLPTLYKMGSAALRSAPVGAIAGLGHAGIDAKFEEQATTTGVDAAASGLIGGLLPGAAAGYRGLSRMVKGQPLEKEGTAAAQEFVRKALAADQLTPEQAIIFLQKAEQAGKPVTLADLGPNLRSNLDTAYQRGGPSQAGIMDSLVARDKGALARMNKDLADLTGGKDTAYFTDLQEMIASRKEVGDELYGVAYSESIPASSELNEVLRRPLFKEAWKEAHENAANRGQKLGYELTENGVIDVEGKLVDSIPTELIDHLKKGADSVISKGIKNGSKKFPDQMDARDTLLNLADEANPAFKKARSFWSGEKAMEDAQELGRNFQTLKSSDRILYEIRNMGAAEKDAFRYGAMTKIRDDIGGIATGETEAVLAGNKARTLLTNPQKLSMIEATFDDKKAYRRFIEAFKQEMDMKMTMSNVMGGSQTAARLAGEKNFQGIVEKHTPADLGVFGILNNARRIKGAANAAKEQEAAASEMARIMTGSADDLGAMLKQLQPQKNILDPIKPPYLPTLYPERAVPSMLKTGARGLLGG